MLRIYLFFIKFIVVILGIVDDFINCFYVFGIYLNFFGLSDILGKFLLMGLRKYVFELYIELENVFFLFMLL